MSISRAVTCVTTKTRRNVTNRNLAASGHNPHVYRMSYSLFFFVAAKMAIACGLEIVSAANRLSLTRFTSCGSRTLHLLVPGTFAQGLGCHLLPSYGTNANSTGECWIECLGCIRAEVHSRTHAPTHTALHSFLRLTPQCFAFV